VLTVIGGAILLLAAYGWAPSRWADSDLPPEGGGGEPTKELASV
jgi:hypothetical protein